MNNHRDVEQEYAKHAAYYDTRWAEYNRVSSSRTLDAIKRCINTKGTDGRLHLLDIACGTGLLLDKLHAELSAVRLSGVDLSQPMLNQAHQRLGRNATLHQADAAQLPFNSGEFDTAVCNSAIQYFTNLPAFFAETLRILKPGGHLIITAWARDTFVSSLHYRGLRWRFPTIRHILKSAEYTELLETAGFELLDSTQYNAGIRWQLATITARKPRIEKV